jgi:tRNA pseudouridine32 synthase / 23S rRNA pseudouridine746 synthase
MHTAAGIYALWPQRATELIGKICMKVVFYDNEIIVIEKPGGLLSVPGRGPDKQDCVVNRVRRMFPDVIAQPAVHRLDMHTSGIMILARTRESHRQLSMQFEQHIPNKIYIALLDGIIREREGKIELPFRLDPDNRPFQIYDPIHGRTGITLWRRLGIEENCTRIEFRPITGRTHQLRLHSAHELGLNTPIVGDALYGRGQQGDRMMLHASSLSVDHPLHGEKLTFTSTVPF